MKKILLLWIGLTLWFTGAIYILYYSDGSVGGHEESERYILVSNKPYNEADIRYIACSFTSEGKFFCVNTNTGTIWTPTKRGVIV